MANEMNKRKYFERFKSFSLAGAKKIIIINVLPYVPLKLKWMWIFDLYELKFPFKQTCHDVSVCVLANTIFI